jgi:hypothetical protein
LPRARALVEAAVVDSSVRSQRRRWQDQDRRFCRKRAAWAARPRVAEMLAMANLVKAGES